MKITRGENGEIHFGLAETEAWTIQHVFAELASGVACADWEYPARVGASYEEVVQMGLEMRRQLEFLGFRD